MSTRKTALNADVKVRLTAAEKDVLRRTAARMRVDMSVWCRSAIVDALNNADRHRDDLLVYQQQLSLMTEHILRVRALLNADLVLRCADGGEQVAALANQLQSQWTGIGTDNDD
jgi:hypothetical protein